MFNPITQAKPTCIFPQTHSKLILIADIAIIAITTFVGAWFITGRGLNLLWLERGLLHPTPHPHHLHLLPMHLLYIFFQSPSTILISSYLCLLLLLHLCLKLCYLSIDVINPSSYRRASHHKGDLIWSSESSVTNSRVMKVGEGVKTPQLGMDNQSITREDATTVYGGSDW